MAAVTIAGVNIANELTNHVFVDPLSHFGPALRASKPAD
jgi:hypothetical protein